MARPTKADRAVLRLQEAGRARAALMESLVVAERELDAAIVAADIAGVPRRAIGREAGVVRQTVYNVLARQGRKEGAT